MEDDPFSGMSDELLAEGPSESRIAPASHPTSSRPAVRPAYVQAVPVLSKNDDAYWIARADRKAHRTGADGQPRVKDRKRAPRVKKGSRGGVFMSWLLDTFHLKERQKRVNDAALAAIASSSSDVAAVSSASASLLSPPFPQLPPFHLVDVAGGRGQIAFMLSAFHSLHVSVVDPATMGVRRYAERYHEQRVKKRRAAMQKKQQEQQEGAATAVETEEQVQHAPLPIGLTPVGASSSNASVDPCEPIVDPATGVRLPVTWLPQLHHYKCCFPSSIALSLHKQYARPAPSPSSAARSTTAESSSDEEIQVEDEETQCCSSPAPLAASPLSPTAEASLMSTLDATLASCSLLYGMHADGATEALVDYALQHGKPFAVVPCCVFPSAALHRRVRRKADPAVSAAASSSSSAAAPADQWVPVRSYDQFLDYLQAKHPSIQRANLPFEGRNTVIFRTLP